MNKLVVRSLYFDPQDFFGTDITEIGSKRYLFGLFLQNNFAVHVPLNSSRQRTVEEKFDAILMENERKLPDWQEAAAAELTLLLLKLKRYATDSNSVKVYSEIRGASLTASVVHLSEQHYSDSSFSLKTAADLLHINQSSISRKFFEVTGKHFSEYLCSYRMQQAAALTLETDLSNEELALTCGYSDFSSFYRQFRQVLGTTPGEFRKRKKTEANPSVSTVRNMMYDEIAYHLLYFQKKDTISLVATAFFRFRNGMKISPNTVHIIMTSLPVTSSRKQFLWKTTTSSEL